MLIGFFVVFAHFEILKYPTAAVLSVESSDLFIFQKGNYYD